MQACSNKEFGFGDLDLVVMSTRTVRSELRSTGRGGAWPHDQRRSGLRSRDRLQPEAAWRATVCPDVCCMGPEPSRAISCSGHAAKPEAVNPPSPALARQMLKWRGAVLKSEEDFGISASMIAGQTGI